MSRFPRARAAIGSAFIATMWSLLAIGESTGAQPGSNGASPEAAKHNPSAMVVTANPHATDAGTAVLRAGGSAVDAAIAIEAVLSLVEPQSSGLGGGAFMTHYDRESGEIVIYDGREVAPAGAHADMFLKDDGSLYGYLEAKNSGLSVGVPGVVAMLNRAHEDHGKLPWAGLFNRAIELSDEGFDVSPRLRSFFDRYGARLLDSGSEDGPKEAYNYFYNHKGELRTRLVNTAYADTLRRLQKNPRALYEGDLAEEIVAAVQHAPRAGSMTLADLESYRARKLTPLCVAYRDLDVCGPPPPSSWLAVGMMLGILEASSFPTDDRLADWTTFTETQRLAYADRDHFVADDTAVQVPVRGLLNRDYLATRAAMINPKGAASTVLRGDPWAYEPGEATARVGEDTTIDYAGTSHFVVVDQNGNVVSMTASVESIFGSARMAGGMFLNNQLTDFAKQPRDADGDLVANHPDGGKRPRSSMAPTIALDKNGEFRLATDSPGGNSILAYTAKTLVGIIDWKLTPQQAIELPNVVARGDTVRVETTRAPEEMLEALRSHGFNVRESAGENSGLSIVRRHPDGRLEGGVDPRREGTIGTLP